MSDELDVEIRKLPKSVEPSVDLWPDIVGRIEARARTRRRVATTAGVLAMAAAVALWIAATRDRARVHELAPTWASAQAPFAAAPAPAPRPAPAPEVPAVDLIPGEGQLRSAATELASAFERRRPLLDRELIAVYDENLGIVDGAIERSRAALVGKPEDAHLQRVLDRAYRHKLALLRRAASEGGAP